MYLTAAEFQPVNFHPLILQQRLENTINPRRFPLEIS